MEDDNVVSVVFDSTDVATILAALRYWQDNVEDPRETSPEHFDEVAPLDDEAIDDLCERINCADPVEDPVIVIEGGVVQSVVVPMPNGKCKPVAYHLIDYDALQDGMSCADVLELWNSFSPAWQKYYRAGCKDEFENYFETTLNDACDCDERSWHGPEHDTACPVEGAR